MSRTKKYISRKNKVKKTQKTQNSNTIKMNTTKFTARIIIKDNVGGIVVDKDTIKEILESIGGKVEVVIYNDIKNNMKDHMKNHMKNHMKSETKSHTKYKNVNIQIFIEHVILEYPLETFPADKSYIFVNQEYIQDWDIDRMLDKNKSQSIIPLCKTHESLKTLHNIDITNAKYVGFGNNRKFAYMDTDKISKIPNLFIHIVGGSPMKGTKTLIDTWITKKIKEPLIITANNKSSGNTNLFNYWKSLNPKIKQLPESILKKWEEWKKITNSNSNSVSHLPQFQSIDSYSVYFCGTVVDYNVIQFLQSIADVHMCPSLIEGWGQYIDEGRRTKSVVLTLDAPPMNELIRDELITDKSTGFSTGVLVKSSKGPNMRNLLPFTWKQYFTKNIDYNTFLYGTYKTSVNDLYNGIKRILKMTPEQKRQLGNNAFKQSQHDYKEFKKRFTKLVLEHSK